MKTQIKTVSDALIVIKDLQSICKKQRTDIEGLEQALEQALFRLPRLEAMKIENFLRAVRISK